MRNNKGGCFGGLNGNGQGQGRNRKGKGNCGCGGHSNDAQTYGKGAKGKGCGCSSKQETKGECDGKGGCGCKNHAEHNAEHNEGETMTKKENSNTKEEPERLDPDALYNCCDCGCDAEDEDAYNNQDVFCKFKSKEEELNFLQGLKAYVDARISELLDGKNNASS